MPFFVYQEDMEGSCKYTE